MRAGDPLSTPEEAASQGTWHEVPFVSGMEREPEAQKPVIREYTFSIARGLVHIHGMVHSVADVVSALANKVRTLADRGPKDYVESEFERGVRTGVRYGGYHEKPNGGGGNLKAVIIGCTIVLISGGIAGAIAFSNQFSEFRGQVLQWQKSMEAQQKQVESRIDRLENQRH
jgi:hypothetical protein